MKNLRITVDGKAYDVSVELLDEASTVSRPVAPVSMPTAGASVVAPVAPAPAPVAATSSGADDVPSPLAGKVVSIDTKIGSVVNAGDQLLTLEAMKMNTLIFAPKAGTVTAILVNSGDGVQEGQPLCTIA